MHKLCTNVYKLSVKMQCKISARVTERIAKCRRRVWNNMSAFAHHTPYEAQTDTSICSGMG